MEDLLAEEVFQKNIMLAQEFIHAHLAQVVMNSETQSLMKKRIKPNCTPNLTLEMTLSYRHVSRVLSYMLIQ